MHSTQMYLERRGVIQWHDRINDLLRNRRANAYRHMESLSRFVGIHVYERDESDRRWRGRRNDIDCLVIQHYRRHYCRNHVKKNFRFLVYPWYIPKTVVYRY